MKKNVKLIEDHGRSSWDVTMENLKKLDPNIDDIAGLFYQSNKEYSDLFNDLMDCTSLHSDLITNVCLARIFHHRLPTLPEQKFSIIVKLASDLPFHFDVFSVPQPKIDLDILRRNFEMLYKGAPSWQAKTTALSLKFHLWKFAHTINQSYNKELYTINLELIEKEFAMDETTNYTFQKMKQDYLCNIIKNKEKNQEILNSILSNPDAHCSCCG